MEAKDILWRGEPLYVHECEGISRYLDILGEGNWAGLIRCFGIGGTDISLQDLGTDFAKVQLFWEGLKNLELSSTCFDIHLVNQLICQNNWKITAKFCGLFRKAELYIFCPKNLSQKSFLIQLAVTWLVKNLPNLIFQSQSWNEKRNYYMYQTFKQ